MKIIYDAHIYLSQKTGGISRYHYELFKGMRQLGHDAKIVGLFVKNQYLLSDSRYKKSFLHDPTASLTLLNKTVINCILPEMPTRLLPYPKQQKKTSLKYGV
ncbi:hypothetical protein Barb6_01393 [Bacteroidales bacterium Barb6]|nr:hypothetical protein Barb6_01393 [Bacteroidales bacterium Barb6]